MSLQSEFDTFKAGWTERVGADTAKMMSDDIGVLDRRLADGAWLAGNYSIADMASYPWIVPWKRQGQDLAAFPNLRRWFDAMRAYEKGAPWTNRPTVIEEGKSIMFGQTARSDAT